MCGISGGWTPSPLPPEAIDASLSAIRHRGPDDAGVFHEQGVFIGMRRLSIIDLDGGQQPIFNEDGSVAVVFNGEIYNYKELIPMLKRAGHQFATESDTEVLVHLWETFGTEMCQHLRGMFAFAIWDKKKRVMFAARDRFGKKPLYMTRTRDGGLLFASELKALRPLARAAKRHLEISQQAIYDYLSLGFVPQPTTIYEDVELLPPASWMLFDGESLKLERYWDLSFKPKLKLSYKDAMVQLRELLVEAVRLRLRSDVPLGVYLSGGVDSSILAYEASQVVGRNLQTFTVGVKDPTRDESQVAQRTAKALNVENKILHLEVDPLNSLPEIVEQYDQPFADSSAIPSLALSRLAREHVTVVLNGDGGDELFAGYRRYVAATLIEKLRWLPQGLLKTSQHMLTRYAPQRRSTAGFLLRLLRGLGQPTATRYLSWSYDLLREEDKPQIWLGEPMRPTETWLDATLPLGLQELDTMLCGDHRVILLSDLLVKMDIATMAASLEGRSPFMDHVLAEFAARLPDQFRVRGLTPKGILRDAYSGLLPDEVIRGAKRGFEVPIASWLKHELRPLVMDTLTPASAHVRSWLDGAFVDGVIHGDIMRDRNLPTMLYSLLMLELWLRRETAR